MLWFELFSPPCINTKVLENDMKINESKQIRMKTDWIKTVIKVDLTKSFSNCAFGDLKL